jgi:hypothetical protein
MLIVPIPVTPIIIDMLIVTIPVTPIIIDMLTFNNNRFQPFTLSGKNGNVRLCGKGDQFRYRQNQVPAW